MTSSPPIKGSYKYMQWAYETAKGKSGQNVYKTRGKIPLKIETEIGCG